MHKTVLSKFLWAGALSLGMTFTSISSGHADVEIIRDNTGLPHVYGDNNYEVFYGFGYVFAQDRLFQMEMRKRQAQGRISEVLGTGEKGAKPGSYKATLYLNRDKQSRLMWDQASIRRQFLKLSEQEQLLIKGFTAGINDAISRMMADPENRLSKAFKDYDFLPEKWTVFDTLTTAIDVLGAYSAFTTQLTNLQNYDFLQAKYPKNCDDIFDQFIWLGDPNAPATLLDHQAGGPDPIAKGPRGCAKPGTMPNGLRAEGSGAESSELQLYRQLKAEPMRASMAWATGRDNSEGARSIFINGPQAGWHSPAYYYPVGLHGGDFDLVGFAADGSFVLPVGVNRNFAWGYTAGVSAQVDVYQEQLDPSGQRYQFNGDWHAFTKRTEVIKVRNEKDISYVIPSSIHGPVIGSDRNKNVSYTQKISWTGGEAGSVMAWLRATRATTPDAWLKAASEFNFNYNWFYADKQGQVGFVHTGLFPVRKPGHDHRLPASGSGEYEWTGLLDPAGNPSLITPKRIINFNNKPARNWPNSGLYWEEWSEVNQTNILIDAMAKKERLNKDEMWDINRTISYHDVSANYFIPFIIKAGKSLDPGSLEAQAIKLLGNWDRMRTDDNRDGFFDHPGQTIFDAWLPLMVQNTLGATLEGFKGKGTWLHAGYQTRDPRLEEHPTAGTQITYHALMNTEDRSGVKHHYSFFQNRKPEDVILQSLREALAGLGKKHEGPIVTWRNKTVGQVFFPSNVARIPMASPDSMARLPLYANRGVSNLMVVYGKDGNISYGGYVNPPGVSGHVPVSGDASSNAFLSNHLAPYDQLKLLPVHLNRENVIKNQAGGSVRLGRKEPAPSKL